jgi:serine/threonine protein kinase
MNKMLHEDNYTAMAKLAEGSYGEIFLVSEKQTKKKYVLKALELKKLIKEERLHEAYV